MFILTNYTLEKVNDRCFKVNANQKFNCTVCNSNLIKFGYKKRKFIPFEQDEKVTYILQRVKCNNCGNIHVLLPNNLVPYRRHESITVEACINAKGETDFPINCHSSTVYRIKKWFKTKTEVIYSALVKRRKLYPINGEPPLPTQNKLQENKGWLRNIAWDLINHRFLRPTHFAYT
ncbi:MAG: DUF6431 domain-containing protein [Rickettsiales bacterium]|jgi:ferredoxin|nr:DUF6431 domain-containing protein [Rickettsiales bacterium]